MVGRLRESAPWAGKPGTREPRIKAARRIGQRDAFPGGVGAAYAAGESGAADVGIAANRDAPVWDAESVAARAATDGCCGSTARARL